MSITSQNYQGIIQRYADRLPVNDSTPVVSLYEGNTPLIRLNHLAHRFAPQCEWYVKFEGLNPTGSFKDRGMTLAVSKAAERGCQAIVCASTGNTSAAAAAYAARAGMQAVVLIPQGHIALGKLAQAMIHGAKVIQIRGSFDDGMAMVRSIAEKMPIEIVNSINPYRLQGQKTAAFEIVEELSDAPDYHCLPVGNAGNISAYWMGYSEYADDNKATQRPKMLGYQAAGAAPFIQGDVVSDPQTVATAIRIGAPQSWQKATDAVQQSQGWFAAVTDEEILQAQQLLAQSEGIFCEPASAASIAGLLNDIKHGKIKEGSCIVCTLTGHGLKDPDIAIKQQQGKMQTVAADIQAVTKLLEDIL